MAFAMMNLLLQLLLCAIGVTLLCYGADFLVRGGVRIANALKIPSIIIGLTLVSFATSAPELVVSIDAAIENNGDISIGNVMGSNVSNIGLILGLTCLISPVKVEPRLLKFDSPVLLFSTILLIFFTMLNGGVTRIEAAILLTIFVLYMWKTIADALKGEAAPSEEETPKGKPISMTLAFVFVIGGILALVGGAKLFVNASVEIAKISHVSDAVIALTIVAIGTSLPELATSVVAAYKGENGIAVGNVIGSNIFNILSILGIAPLVRPIKAAGIHTADIMTMGILTVLMVIMMASHKTVSRLEGALLLLLYIGYISFLVVQNVG